MEFIRSILENQRNISDFTFYFLNWFIVCVGKREVKENNCWLIQLVSRDAQISKVHSNFSWLVLLPTFQNIDIPHLDLFYLNSTFAHRWVTDRIEIDLTFQRWQTVAWGHCWKSHFFWFMLYIGWVYSQITVFWYKLIIKLWWSDMRPVPDVSVTLVPDGQQIKGNIPQPCCCSRYQLFQVMIRITNPTV